MDNHAASKSISDRLDFIGLDPASLARIGTLKPLIDKHMPTTLERFYTKIATVPAVSRHFSGRQHIEHAKARQTTHWSAIVGRIPGHWGGVKAGQ